MPIGPCGTPAPVHGVVVFDPAIFIAIYPMFATVPAPALQNNFNQATLQLDNSCGSRVQDANRRELLLGLLTAHITALQNGVDGEAPAGIVGRISSASQGSVSVQAEYPVTGQAMAYYVQTAWGAQYWKATSKYRRAVYVPGPQGGCGYGGGPGSWGPGFGPE